MNQSKLLIIALLISHLNIFSQEKKEIQALDTVLIKSTRIDLPFKENARTIQVISAEFIKNSAATNVADLLQQVAGVDIRRRGTAGSQADLYIRDGVLKTNLPWFYFSFLNYYCL